MTSKPLSLVVAILGIAVFTSCKKPLECRAYDQYGNILGDIKGEGQCQSQIDQANGEYCDCKEQ